MRHTRVDWHLDETYIRVGGNWPYLRRAIDAHGQSLRSLRSVKATPSGRKTTRTIKRDHIYHKQPGIKGETEFVETLVETVA